MTAEKRTEPNGLIIEEEENKLVFTQHPQTHALLHEKVHQIKFQSGKETFQFDFGYSMDTAGRNKVGNDFKFTYNGRRCADLFALDKKFLPDDLFLQMAENFPPRDEQSDINKSLEHRLMKVDTSKLSGDKLKEAKERLQKISDKGHVGATISLVNILVDEYSALPEDKKAERANMARKIVDLSRSVPGNIKGDKYALAFEPSLFYALQKNEEIAALTHVKDVTRSPCEKLGEIFLGKARKGTNIRDDALEHNKRMFLGRALVGIPAAVGGIALFVAINGPAMAALAGGAVAIAAGAAAYNDNKEKIDGFLAAAKKTLTGR